MKHSISFGALAIFLAGCAGVKPAPPPVHPEYTILAVGAVNAVDLAFESEEFPLVGNRNMLNVQKGVKENEWKIVGLSAGTTKVEFRQKDGSPGRIFEIEVITGEQARTLKHVQNLVGKVEGITVKPGPGIVIIDGALINPDSILQDFDRLLKVTELFQETVANLVTISPELFEASARKMTEEIQADPDSKGLSVRVVNGTFLIIGNVPSAVLRDRAEAITQTYLPPMLSSQAIRDGLLIVGAKKFSIRNFIQVIAPGNRAPASSK